MTDPEIAQEIYEFVRDHHNAYGFAPTIREIGEAVGLSSTATTSHYLDVLRTLGRIDWQRGRARTITVVTA